jgi:Lipocalin-like domain
MIFCQYSRRTALCSIALLAVALSACKKDAPEMALDANTGALASHPWHISAYLDTDNTVTPHKTVDVYPGFPAYRRDDTYQFNADNNLVFEEGSLKAKSTDPQTTAGKWQFQNNQAGLTITLARTVALGTTGSTNSSTYSILKLTPDTLRITNGSFAQTIVVTLVK